MCPPNMRPTATAPDFSAARGQVISAASLFSAIDADNDILMYFLHDQSPDPASGHFTVDGVVQAADTTFAVTAAQLAQTTFTAGSRLSDDLVVNVYDGARPQRAAGVSSQCSPEPAPTATASDFTGLAGPNRRRLVVVLGERPRQRPAAVFLLRQHAGSRERPFRDRRHGAARQHQLRGRRGRSWRRPPSSRGPFPTSFT